MRAGSGLDKFASVVLVLCVGIVVSGTKACQTDYEVGVQSKVPTETATGTPTTAGTGEENGTATATPTGEVTATAAATATGAATATPDPSQPEEEASGGDDLFNELSKLDGDGSVAGKAPAAMAGRSGSVIQPENWLGEAFSQDDSSWQDSDGDGFCDSLEEEFGTDPNGAGSAPLSILKTRLAARVGPEAVGDEAPRESGDIADADNDGVSDETEEQRGMNPRSMDSDGDGLPDGKELQIGSNPLQIDSDGDGISDGREFDFGADPTIAEPKQGGN